MVGTGVFFSLIVEYIGTQPRETDNLAVGIILVIGILLLGSIDGILRWRRRLPVGLEVYEEEMLEQDIET